jgi:adenylate cyclase
LDENDSRCHRILVPIYTHLRQYDLAELHSDKSIALNPNDAIGAINRAILFRFLGRAEEGVVWARKATQLNPYHPNWYSIALAHLQHTAGQYAEALESYGQITERPSFYHAYVAACHAELGHMEEARKHAALALQARPDFSVTAQGKKLPFKHEADLQGFLDGLRKAGLPE